jgi:hypothetical protein
VANYTGLHGKGIQSLTPGTTLIDVLPTTYPPRATIGEANPPNWYHIGLLRFGSSGFFQPAFPIDADNMWVPVPPGADEVAYSIMSGGVVTIEETISSTTVPNWQKQPWDRNPVVQSDSKFYALPGGGDVPQTVLYTVPANRLFLLTWFEVTLVRTGAATGVNVVAGWGYVRALGMLVADLRNITAGVEITDRFDSGGVVLTSGEQVEVAGHNYEGDGQVTLYGNFAGTEFDA